MGSSEKRPPHLLIVALGLVCLVGLGGAERERLVKEHPFQEPDPSPSDLSYLMFHDAGAPEAKAICSAVAKLRPRPADLPDAATLKALKGCESAAFYYGLGRPRDVVRARQCAFAEIAATADDPAIVGLGGPGILANIYANGAGVPRDLDLAIHFACANDADSIHDVVARVKHLQSLRTAGKPAPFDYCDDVESDYEIGECVVLDSRRAEMARARAAAALAVDWTPAQRAAFATLDRAEAAFANARADKEIYAEGTDRFYNVPGAREEVRKAGGELLQAVAAGKLPPAGPTELAAADVALNKAWRDLMASTEPWEMITRKGVREAERSWLSYRDAWLAFVRLTYPAQADGLALRLMRERTQKLTCMRTALETC